LFLSLTTDKPAIISARAIVFPAVAPETRSAKILLESKKSKLEALCKKSLNKSPERVTLPVIKAPNAPINGAINVKYLVSNKVDIKETKDGILKLFKCEFLISSTEKAIKNITKKEW